MSAEPVVAVSADPVAVVSAEPVATASASPEPPRCPFCDSPEIELVSPWGGQLITSLVRCQACNTHFEAVRDAFDAPRPAATPSA